MTAVDFGFDVMYPWAHRTGKWIRQARQVRDVTVTWRFSSARGWRGVERQGA